MSARRKRAAGPWPAGPKNAAPSSDSQAAVARQKSSTSISAHNALDECVGAICLVEVTLHSLEWQEIASPEQEVLKRALKAIWVVHDWIDDLAFKELRSEDAEQEGEP